MPQSKEARGAQLLSLCSRARKPQLLSHVPQLRNLCALESVLLSQRSHCNGKPMYHNQRGAPALCNQRKARAATKTLHSQKSINQSISKIIKKKSIKQNPKLLKKKKRKKKNPKHHDTDEWGGCFQSSEHMGFNHRITSYGPMLGNLLDQTTPPLFHDQRV